MPYGQPYGIDQCQTVVEHWPIRQFWHNNFTSFLVNLLLDPIGMLIPWLESLGSQILTRVWTIQSCSLDPTSDFETMNSELQNAQLKGFYYDVLELHELSCGLWAITIVGKL